MVETQRMQGGKMVNDTDKPITQAFGAAPAATPANSAGPILMLKNMIARINGPAYVHQAGLDFIAALEKWTGEMTAKPEVK